MRAKKVDKKILDGWWKEFKEKGDQEFRGKLITNYLYLVKYVVGRMMFNLPAHVKYEDLNSTGIIGLIKAIEKYNPEMKNKFETYAVLLIKGSIIDEMRSHDWVPRSVHQKSNEIASAQEFLLQKLGRDATDKELAAYLGVTPKVLQDLFVRVRPAVLIPLNVDSSDDEKGPISERIPDKKVKNSYETADYNEFRKLLEKAVLELPEQERTVLVLYYYENMMLKEIGKVIGVSESRTSQIHSKAVLRLRGRLKGFAKEFVNMLS